MTYRAVVRDNASHQRTSDPQGAVVPAPKLTIQLPAEGAGVFGKIEVRVLADPERSSQVVQIQRRLHRRGLGDPDDRQLVADLQLHR